jgi:hypothetical protein
MTVDYFNIVFNKSSPRGSRPEALAERIRAIVKSSGRGKGEWDAVKPLRTWNADDWYFKTEGSGLKVYGTANGSAPPLEIVDLFHELDKSRGPRKPSRH